MRFVGSRREWKGGKEGEGREGEGREVREEEECNVKRSVFVAGLWLLCEAGVKCSEYMRQLRVDNMVKSIVDGMNKQLQ